MKKQILSIILAIVGVLPHSGLAGLILNTGESYDYEFNFDSVTDPYVDQTYSAIIYYTGVKNSSGSVSWYEDSIAEAEFEITSLYVDFEVGLLGSGLFHSSEAHWQDLQGAIRIEAINGLIEIDSIKVSTSASGNFYEQTIAIPEPSSLALAMASGALILFIRRKILL